MKVGYLIITSLVLSANLLLAKPVTGQGFENTKLVVGLRNESLKSAISQIEQQTQFKCAFVESQVEAYNNLSLPGHNRTLKKTLDLLLLNTRLQYMVNGNTIILVEKSRPPGNGREPKNKETPEGPANNASDSTKIPIKGLVTNTTGAALGNVSITEKGTANGTVTKEDGSFSLTVSKKDAVLVFSYVGYAMQEITPGTTSFINVQLKDAAAALNDVVVVGYGTQKKVTVTGAVSSITGAEARTTPNGDLTEMLTGKLPGLRVAQVDGEPGNYSAAFDIRGFGGPTLVVVDGVPRDNFNRIDPNEIESVSILKDASAAVYGVRAANGVILITTKKGKNGPPRLTYTGRVGVGEIANSPKVLNAYQYATLLDESEINQGASLTYTQDDLTKFQNGTNPSTNWQDLITRKYTPQQQHNLSATGGTENVKYFLSLGYDDEQGIWKSGDLNYKRYNFRSNITAQLSKDLDAELFIGGFQDAKNQPGQPTWIIFKSIWMQMPTIPVYANNNPAYLSNVADGTHPLAITNSNISGYTDYTNRNFQGTFALNYKIPTVQGLKARFMFAYDPNYNFSKQWTKQYTLYDYDNATNTYSPSYVNTPSNLTDNFADNSASDMQLSLDYTKNIAKDHNIKALVLFERRHQSGNSFFGNRQFTVDAVDQLYAGNAIQTINSNVVLTSASEGVVGRLNYDYKGKYLVEGSFREDGSSKFGSGHQWGFFPSIQGGWRISEEGFIKNNEKLNFINNLKIRGSYGILGDDNASSYQWVSGYGYPGGSINGYPAGSVFGGTLVTGLGYASTPNPNITWFTSKTLDFGLEGDLYNGGLHFEMDYYQRHRNGLLGYLNLSLPGTVGASLPQENLNSDLTKGYEILLSTRQKAGKFIFTISGNITYARTKNLHIEQTPASNPNLNWTGNQSNRWNDIYWGYTVLGHFKSLDEIKNAPIEDGQGNKTLIPGDFKYADLNHDGIIDGNDEKPIGRSTGIPEMNFGLTFNVQWKGFDLNLLAQGATKFQFDYLGTDQLHEPLPYGRNGLDVFLDRWHRADLFDPNSAWIPGKYPSTKSLGPNYLPSTFWLQDASYLRLKSVEFGYTIPLKKGIKSFRVYVTGFNLLTWSHMNGFIDPEHTNGTYGYQYPVMKNYNFGVNINF